MNGFSNDDSLRIYLKKESNRLNISIGNIYNTFFSRDLLYRLSRVDHNGDMIVKGSFAQFVHLNKFVRPITDIDLTSTIDHHVPLILLINAMCVKESDNDIDYNLRDKIKKTKSGIIKIPIAASYGRINHPIGIDYRENHPCIYEKVKKVVPKVFLKDEEYEITVASMEETLAEKLYVIAVAKNFTNGTLNTRAKDFYDVYQLHGGNYDLDKFSYYFEKMVRECGGISDVNSLNADYLNQDFIDRHKQIWENNKRKYEFLDNGIDLSGAVYYTRSVLIEQYQKIRQGKNRIYSKVISK